MKNNLPIELYEWGLIVSRFLFFGIVLQTLAGSFLLAAEGNAQNKSIYEISVALNEKEQPLLRVFDKIETITDFTFSYNSEVIDEDQPISIRGKKSLGKQLEHIAVQASLRFKRIDNNIHVYRQENNENPVQETLVDRKLALEVSGKITDEFNEGLPGATVLEKGTTNGTTTNVEGNYTLNVTEDAVLVVSFVGYNTSEIPVNGRSIVNVQLEVNIQSLSEVVVIGYGTQRKRDLTGAAVGVSAEEIQDVPVNTFEQSLQGRLPGVQITQGNAAPGGGVQIRIRGTNSISGNSEPLYVIDGVPIISSNAQGSPGGNSIRGLPGNIDNEFNALSTLNPNDIEDIQVLKDAAASAIYGARGANGVVLITTKRGKVGKPQISLDSYIGFQSLSNEIDLVGPEEWAVAYRESYDNVGVPRDADDDFLAPLIANPTDWQDLVLRDPTDATIRNVQLSVSGATQDDLNYFISASNFDQRGIVRGSGFVRNSFRLNLEKGFERFRFGTNVSFSRTDTDVILAGNDLSVTRFAASGNPLQPIFDENGDFLHETVIQGGLSANPEALIRGNSDNLIADRLLGSIFAEYEFIKGLKFRTTLGVDVDRRDREIYYDRNTGPRFGGTDQPGLAELASTNNTQIVTTNTLSYDVKFSEDHQLNLTGVFEAQTFDSESFSIVNRGFTSDAIGAQAISSGTQEGGPTVANSAFEWQIASWVGRAFYSFKDRYLITATVRHDGSSRFGENNRWGTFPSVGVGWRISDESFLSEISVLNELKLRGSYGITGNQEIGVLQTAERYVPTLGTLFGGVLANSVEAVSFSNPNLGWEESEQINLGLDATFLEARINLTFDYYVRTTSDLLLAVNIPPSSGFDRPIFNEGEIENRGIEIALNTVPIENDNFQWNLGFNLSRNRNEVLRILSERDFGPPLDAVFTGSVIQEGSPLGAFFGYQTNGVYATQEEADADLPNGTLFPKEAGEYRYVDVNGDGELNEDDRTIIGDPNPDFIYGITSTFKYKNFSLDVAFQGVQGNDIFWTNARLIYPGGVDARGVHQDRFDNRWTPENPNAEYPRFNINSDENIVNDRLIFDGSFLRLRNIVLAYDIPSTLLEKIKIQRLRVYASATNLLTFTDYPGWNPDVNTTGQNSVNQGVDRNGYPLAKSFQFGINLTF